MKSKKIYNYMEPTFKDLLNKIKLDPSITKRNNEIINTFLSALIRCMKQVDPLFEELYIGNFLGGSFYDGLKIAKPDEFDWDLILNIKNLKPVLTISNKPGFVNINCGLVTKLTDNKGYLSTFEVHRWIHSVIDKALNKGFKEISPGVFVLIKKRKKKMKYAITKSESGPAFTMKIIKYNPTGDVLIDVDLVPSFQFDTNQWLDGGYRENLVPKCSRFLVVPKSPKVCSGDQNRYWRLSFQEQEKHIIHNKNFLKPTLKLMKYLRDSLGQTDIASYYLKTILLLELVDNKFDFRNYSLSYSCICMLKRYLVYIEEKRIPYFWNTKFNLLEGVTAVTLFNIENKLKNIINDIDRNLKNPDVIVKYLKPYIATGNFSSGILISLAIVDCDKNEVANNPKMITNEVTASLNVSKSTAHDQLLRLK